MRVLEQFEKKHDSPADDKAGWKRLIHGAVNKAAGLLWTAARCDDVTLGPSVSPVPDDVPATFKFGDMRSPKSDHHSLSVEADSDSQLFLSFEEGDSPVIVAVRDKKRLEPKSHSTPYKERDTESTTELPTIDFDRKTSARGKGISIDVVSDNLEPVSIGGRTPSNENRIAVESSVGTPRPSELTDLCSEMERLSLKKIISEVEKSIAAEMREEFDEERQKMEEHDKKVAEILAREEEEREMEQQLLEMNWFQKIRESQLAVEKDFNNKLEAILAKVRTNGSDKKIGNEPVKSADERAAELELVAKKRALIESIGSKQKQYNAKYNRVLELLQSTRVTLVSEFHSEFETLKMNNTRLTDVISKSKCGNITQSDVDECSKLLNFLCDLYDKIDGRIKEFESSKKLDEEANLKLMEALKKNEENAQVETSDGAGRSSQEKDRVSEATDRVDTRRSDRIKYYEYIERVLKKAEESLQVFLNDDKYKNFRKDCQRAVNVPINAISPTSAHHLTDKLDKLTDLLDGKSVQVMSRRFAATIHPLGIKYCELLLARKIVKAGEDVVSSHPETGHAIAAVVVSLITRYPVLFVYIQAYFFRVCPYLVPLDTEPRPDETDREYDTRLGFNYDGDEREETDKFLKRMSGVAQLYGAISVSHKRRIDSHMHAPLGISEIWIWLTNFISLEPLSDISATVLLDLLEVCGHFMLTSYGFNFQKLLYFICTDYVIKIDKVTTKGRGGAVERLKTFLEGVIKVKRIPPPKGLLPPHFW